jgi:hypothetical protein
MKRNNKRMSRANRGSGRPKRQGAATSLQPPPYVPTMKLSQKFRFTSGANSGTFSVTRANILDLIGYATTPTSAVRLFEALRLKRVEIWGNNTAGALQNVELEWIGENSPSVIISDTSMGVRPAHVRSTPPTESSNRWWSLSGFSETDVLFSLTVPINAIIDVQLEARVVEKEAPTLLSVLPVGATVGQLYGNYLDGITSGKLAMLDYIPLP